MSFKSASLHKEDYARTCPKKGSQLGARIWVVGHRLNCLDEPVLMAVPKPMLTEVGIHYRLESCDVLPH